MKKMLMLCTTTLLCSLVAAPAAFAQRDNDGDGDFYRSEWRHHDHRHDHNKINYLRTQLERNKAERRKAEWAYSQARRVGDWPTVRFQQARLDRLDREIRQNEHELRRAYERQWDYRYRRDEYSYR